MSTLGGAHRTVLVRVVGLSRFAQFDEIEFSAQISKFSTARQLNAPARPLTCSN